LGEASTVPACWAGAICMWYTYYCGGSAAAARAR
jgi:hypothetical protein